MLGGDPGEILTRVERIDAVTPAVVQEAFKKYFPLDRLHRRHADARAGPVDDVHRPTVSIPSIGTIVISGQ